MKINSEDLINSVCDALQFISYYHPIDYLQSLTAAYHRERSPAARNAMAQILINSRLCSEGKRPLCQDTGMVVVFLDVGMNVQWDSQQPIENLINEGVRRAYTHPDNILRASMVSDPSGKRQNTRDNTPAIIHMRLVPGDQITVKIAAKGGGSENKSRFTVLNPSDSIVDWVLRTVPGMGAGWCPPGTLGIGIGGSAEKALLMAKESLMEPINMHELIERGPQSHLEELRLELFEKVNALGIGAQGLGGLTTVLDIKIMDYPTHAASLPIGMIPNCAATRHVHFTLTGDGPAQFTPPSPDQWPNIEASKDSPAARAVNLETLNREDIQHWKPGEQLLLSGKILTARDAAHQRLVALLSAGKPLPEGVNLDNRLIYYVGPVDPVGDEVVGPAGPTTATRMDKFTEQMLSQTGMIGMIGKAERGQSTIDSIKKHQAVYLIAIGGAAYLVSKAIKKSRIVAFEELGMEAIYEFTVENMPVTVAVDSRGQSVHQSGPKKWRVTLPMA
jgi:fumarate hydratase class I